MILEVDSQRRLHLCRSTDANEPISGYSWIDNAESHDAGRSIDVLAEDDPALLLSVDGHTIGLTRLTHEADTRLHHDVVLVVGVSRDEHGVAG